ncbi:hypothetical protein [Archangium sp.]|jgi:hypothetical protein|uniref:hypothetical protein n=1 Tax=Archangium sp. TaxID=1872627 RepID=UPI002EDA8D5A
MAEKKKGVSLLEVLEEGAYEAALLTTYNSYLPFFEEVVLRRITARGCRHVVLAMDARQLGQELASPERRPRRAGSTYSLVPVAEGGAFHPKLLLLAGNKAGRLLVGSHNLTYAGYGRNHELTNVLEIEGARDRVGTAAFREALDFVTAWTATQAEPLRDAVKALHGFAPWLGGPVPLDMPVRFVGSRPEGASLWDRVRPLLPGGVRRITVVGPFFDQKLAFLRRLKADFPAAELVVGVVPDEVEIDGTTADALVGVRFVDASELDGATGERRYLHAKALLFETSDGAVLITGSANPSAAAWLAAPGQRNAEAVIVRTGASAEALDEQLGLRALAEAVSVAGRWKPVDQDSDTEPDRPEQVEVPAAVCFVETPEGFEVEQERLGTEPITAMELLDAHGNSRAVFQPTPDAAGRIRIEDSTLREAVDLIRIVYGDGRSRWGIVHRTAKLRELAVSNRQRQFREALGSLGGGDPTQIEKLLALVERVIFDGQPEAEQVRAGTAGTVKQEAAAAETVPLEVSLSATQERRARRWCSNELSVLLDALLRKLSQGLASAEGPSAPQRSDESLIGTEDEELTIQLQVDVHALALACRRKTRALFRKLGKQLENAQKDANPVATTAILQTSAVLGLIQALRQAETNDTWRPVAEKLVDAEAQEEFLPKLLQTLLGPGRLILRAVKEQEGTPFEDLSVLRERLGWLAWDLGMDVWPREATEEAAHQVARLAPVALELAMDERAVSGLAEKLGDTPRRGVEHGLWLERVVAWGTLIARASPVPASDSRSGSTSGLRLGALVIAGSRVFVTLSVREGKAKLAASTDPEDISTFLIRAVTVVHPSSEKRLIRSA